MALTPKVVCLTVLCSTSILVFSLVAIIYATMMIYIPANLEMKANVTGPLKCTTIKMDFNVSQGNCHWSSCIEWCLNKVKLLYIIIKIFGTKCNEKSSWLKTSVYSKMFQNIQKYSKNPKICTNIFHKITK